MSDPLLINLTGFESEGTKWAVVQRWLKLAIQNASITIPMSDPLLTDINFADSEGTKWAKFQRWLALLANNITGGGGGGGTTLQKGTVNLVAGTQSYAIVFTTPFASAPTFLSGSVQMPSSSGEVFDVAFDLSTLTTTGVTAWLSGIPTAASAGGKINWGAAA